jgi:hypothetical protein
MLMENTHIEASAFRHRSGAAEWLNIPVDVLALKDEPDPWSPDAFGDGG